MPQSRRETGTAGHRQRGLGGLVKKDLALFRAFETMAATAMVLVMYTVIQSGALASLGDTFGSWYSDKVDGAFTISIVDTSVKPPLLDRANLPLAPQPEPEEETYSPDEPSTEDLSPGLVSGRTAASASQS